MHLEAIKLTIRPAFLKELIAIKLAKHSAITQCAWISAVLNTIPVILPLEPQSAGIIVLNVHSIATF
jgi:hypothetical protein